LKNANMLTCITIVMYAASMGILGFFISFYLNGTTKISESRLSRSLLPPSEGWNCTIITKFNDPVMKKVTSPFGSFIDIGGQFPIRPNYAAMFDGTYTFQTSMTSIQPGPIDYVGISHYQVYYASYAACLNDISTRLQIDLGAFSIAADISYYSSPPVYLNLSDVISLDHTEVALSKLRHVAYQLHGYKQFDSSICPATLSPWQYCGGNCNNGQTIYSSASPGAACILSFQSVTEGYYPSCPYITCAGVAPACICFENPYQTTRSWSCSACGVYISVSSSNVIPSLGGSTNVPYNATFTLGTAAWDHTTVTAFFKQVLEGYGPKMNAFREAILDTTCKPFLDLPPYSCERLKVLEKPFLEVLSLSIGNTSIISALLSTFTSAVLYCFYGKRTDNIKFTERIEQNKMALNIQLGRR